MPTSPIKGCLEAFCKATAPTCCIYSYRDDFDELWRIVSTLFQRPEAKDLSTHAPDGAKNVVVLWDGAPDPPAGLSGSNVDVADHVTVYYWVVALCCNAQRVEKERLPRLRLFILDLEPTQHSSAFGTSRSSSFD
jgi:hypothetical protein